jgi:hypothetical protein
MQRYRGCIQNVFLCNKRWSRGGQDHGDRTTYPARGLWCLISQDSTQWTLYDMHEEMLEMIQGFDPKLLNQLMIDSDRSENCHESEIDQASIH